MALARTVFSLALAAAVATPAFAQAPAAKPTAAPPAAAGSADAWPKGAPQTDYEFTAWCYGVLRTHMDLYNRVRPELTAISKRWQTEEEDEKSYADQMAAGKMYLAQFAKAIEAAERASPRPINAQGAAAIEQGRKMWSQIDTVDATMQAYSWMNWELPEKCPKVAAALENRSVLMAPALKANMPSKPEPAKPAAAAAAHADPVGGLIKDAGKPAPSKQN